MSRNILLMTGLIAGAAFALGACEMYEPSRLNTSRVEVHHDEYNEVMDVDQVREDTLYGISRDYARQANGPLYLTVTYDPRSEGNTAMNAGMEAGRLAEILRRQGVSDIKTDILPVNGNGEVSQVMVRFDSVTASAPRDCEELSAFDGEPIRDDSTYRVGCAIEAQVARQIARPADLLGREGGSGMSDGRRAANVLEKYRTGAPNEPLEGEQASDN